MDKIIKRILKVLPRRPREELYIETGLLDQETIIKKNRVNMEIRIQINGITLMKRAINKQTKNGRKKKKKSKLRMIWQIDEKDWQEARRQHKKQIKKKALSCFNEKITWSGNYTMKYIYLKEREDWKPGHRPTYMSNLQETRPV